MRKMLFALLLASSAAACHETGDVEYAGEVHVASPELVTVQPGVQVVADADQPLFYADGSYWLYRDNYWMRSDNYQRGFARVETENVPSEVRVIDQPQRYVHYRRHQGGDEAARQGEMRTRSTNAPQGTRIERNDQFPTSQTPSNTTPIEATTTPTPPGSTRANVPSSEPNPRLTPEQREPVPQQHAAPDIDRTNGRTDTSRHDVDRPTGQSLAPSDNTSPNGRNTTTRAGTPPTDHDNDKVDHTDRNVPNPHATDHGKAVGHDKDKDKDNGHGMSAGADVNTDTDASADATDAKGSTGVAGSVNMSNDTPTGTANAKAKAKGKAKPATTGSKAATGGNGPSTANGTAGTSTTSDTGTNGTDNVPNGSRTGDQNNDRTQFGADNRASHAPNEGTTRSDDAKAKAKAQDTKNQNKTKEKDY